MPAGQRAHCKVSTIFVTGSACWPFCAAMSHATLMTTWGFCNNNMRANFTALVCVYCLECIVQILARAFQRRFGNRLRYNRERALKSLPALRIAQFGTPSQGAGRSFFQLFLVRAKLSARLVCVSYFSEKMTERVEAVLSETMNQI